MASHPSVVFFAAVALWTIASSQSAQILKIRNEQSVSYACGVDWTAANTAVACHSMGGTYGSFEVVRADFPRSTLFSPFTWDCSGWEKRLSQCKKWMRNSSCGNAFVSVSCRDVNPPAADKVGTARERKSTNTLRQISLDISDADSSEDYGFVLTIEQNHKERMICASQRSSDQSLVKFLTVACRQLGYTSLSTFEKFTRKDISPYLNDLQPCLKQSWRCFGNESNLFDCDNETLSKASRILYVECSYTAPPREGLVRLIGNHPYRGRVELYHNSLWGQLCPYHHLHNLQVAVCKQLQLGPFVETYQRTDHRTFGRIHDIVLSCEDNVTDLAECQKQTFPPICPSEATLYVTCLPPTEKLSLRLQSISPNETAVQVLFMERWSFIGWDQKWSVSESAVVCRMLQKGPPEYFQATEYYVPGPHLRFHPSCVGTEESLLQCALKVDYVSRYALEEVVSIRCTPQQSMKENAVALVPDAVSDWTSYLLVYSASQWHMVCGCFSVWSDVSADVVCSQLDYTGGIALEASVDNVLMNLYGPPVKLSCPSKGAKNLSECDISPCNTKKCSLAARIHCSKYSPKEISCGSIFVPYIYYIVPFGLLAVALFAYICRKLYQAKRTTSQIVRASMRETLALQHINPDPSEPDLPPPSYDAFIKNPEIYPCVQDPSSSIADEDEELPSYPGFL